MTAAQVSCAVLPWVALLSVQSGAACARRCRVPWTQVCSCEASTSAGTAGSPDVSPDAQLWQRPSWDLRVQPSQQSGSSGRPAPRRLPVSPDPFGGAAVARESRLAHVFACRGRVPRSIPPPLAIGAALAACSPLAGRPGWGPRDACLPARLRRLFPRRAFSCSPHRLGGQRWLIQVQVAIFFLCGSLFCVPFKNCYLEKHSVFFFNFSRNIYCLIFHVLI